MDTPITDNAAANTDSGAIKALVIRHLRAILEDETAPHGARASAGRTLAEMAGFVGRDASKTRQLFDKPVENLTRAEIEARLAALDADG